MRGRDAFAPFLDALSLSTMAVSLGDSSTLIWPWDCGNLIRVWREVERVAAETEVIGIDGCRTTSIDCALVCVIATRSVTGSYGTLFMFGLIAMEPLVPMHSV